MNVYQRINFALAALPPMRTMQVRSAPLRRRIDLALYAASRGRLTMQTGILPCALLTTIGRRSGRPRTTPVVFHERPDALLIVSTGRRAADPDWLRNLRAEPAVRLSYSGEERSYQASIVELDDPRYEGLLDFALERNPTYSSYMDAFRRPRPAIVLLRR